MTIQTHNGIVYSWLVTDVAERYGFSESHARSLAAKGIIPSLKVGRRYYFNPQAVDDALVRVNNQSPSTIDDIREAFSDEYTADEFDTDDLEGL